MSQTETILLILLGFSLASLLALFTLRLVWAAAVRVGVRRMQRQVPSSLAELQAERTRLLAEKAEISQRLGSELAAARLQLAEQMAEVSRHRNRLLALEAGEAQPRKRTAEPPAAPAPSPASPDDRELRLRQRLDRLASLTRKS